MKRLILGMLSLVLVFIVVACAAPAPAPAPAPTPAPAPKPATTPAPAPTPTPASAPAKAWKPQTWKFHVDSSPVYVRTLLSYRFAEEVTKRTEGRLSIVVYPAGVLGIKAADVLEAVKERLVPIALANSVHTAASWPDASFIGGVISDFEKATKVLQMLRPKTEKLLLEKFNVVVAGVYRQFSPDNLFAKKLIEKPEDFKGIICRAPNVAYGNLQKELGMTPVTTAAAEIYMTFERGIAEANMTPDISIKDHGVVRFFKYKYELNWPGEDAGKYIVINKRDYDSLPEDIKAIMKQVEKDIEPYWHQVLIDDTNVATKFLADNGIKTITWSKEMQQFVREADSRRLQKLLATATPVQKELHEAMLAARKQVAGY